MIRSVRSTKRQPPVQAAERDRRPRKSRHRHGSPAGWERSDSNQDAGWSVHPGEVLREEFMKPRDISSYRLARELHVPAPRVHDIVLERRGVSAAMAVRLARFFGTSEQFWMNLQSAYELHQARREGRRELQKIEPLAGRELPCGHAQTHTSKTGLCGAPRN